MGSGWARVVLARAVFNDGSQQAIESARQVTFPGAAGIYSDWFRLSLKPQ